MIKNIQGVSEMTNEQLAEKVEIHSTRNREAKEKSTPQKSSENFNMTKKPEYKHLECVAKERCC